MIVLLRLTGKRIAGRTATFDLIVLITMGVVLESSAVGRVLSMRLSTVLVMHKLVAISCASSGIVRHRVRGKPRVLVRDGKVNAQALANEGISEEELLAGPRKLGREDTASVKLATPEETGHISAVRFEKS